jgi:peptide-methionine (S)-S-oxide reductase
MREGGSIVSRRLSTFALANRVADLKLLPRCGNLKIMPNQEIAVLGGGCFWCLEAVFDRLQGVGSVESGYMGGHVENPTYRQVCGGDTGHVEVVRITFDPQELSYPELLDVFFTVHDPTTPNRQGNDVGPQYRSVIFYTSEEQRRLAEQAIAELNASRTWPNPVVTTVEPAGKFFVAEDYHQEYFANNQSQPYCQFVIAPKVKKFQQKFSASLKA